MKLICRLKDAMDIESVGGKASNLALMINQGIKVPSGFVITTKAFESYIEHLNLKRNKRSIEEGSISSELREEILKFYAPFLKSYVAVRSSAVAEDRESASFAGQQDTFLYIKGEEELLKAVKRCWASLYNKKALLYRKKKGIDEERMGVIVQRMIDAEKSGILFTKHPVSGDSSVILIESNWGCGESVVSGLVNPDRFIMRKQDGELLQKVLGEKEVFSSKGKVIKTPKEKREAFTLNKEELELLRYESLKIEKLFKMPQDIEWAFEQGSLYILQSRAITI